jgi:hypothetical protein
MERESELGEGARPSDTEELVGGTAASERLTDRSHAVQPGEADSRGGQGAPGAAREAPPSPASPDTILDPRD